MTTKPFRPAPGSDSAVTSLGTLSSTPVRGRNVRLDALLRAVNGSTRYSVTAIEEQAAKALALRKK